MKKIILPIFIFFVSVSLIAGASFMRHEDIDSHSGCVAAILGNGNCESTDVIGSIVLHLNILLGLFTAILANAGVTLSAFIVLALVPLVPFAPPPREGFVEIFRSDQSPGNKILIKLLHWISVHEKRDPSLAF